MPPNVEGGDALLTTHRVWGVGDPALAVLVGPVSLEVFDRLGVVVGDGVEGGAVTGAAHGDVSELSAAAGGVDVGPVVGRALGSVDGEGVGGVEVAVVDSFCEEGDLAAVVGGYERCVGRGGERTSE